MSRPLASLFAVGTAPSPHVTLHGLVTWFQTGVGALAVDALLAAAAVAYLVGLRALGRRHRAPGRPWWRWPVARTVSWVAGLAGIFVAVCSGLAAYADPNPSVLVIQHVLLMMVVPPLLVAARPVTVLVQAVPRPAQVRVVRLFGSHAMRVLTGPVAWPVYYASMAAYFLTPLYAGSVRTPALHDVTDACFLAIGCLFWLGIVSVDLPIRRRTFTGRIGTLLVGMPVETAIAVSLLFWPSPLAPGETVAAAHEAGLVLWLGSMLTSGVGLAAVIAQWMAADSRRTERFDLVTGRRGASRVAGYDVRADGSAVPVASVD